MLWIIIVIIICIMFKSILEFLSGGLFKGRQMLQESRFSIELFYTLMVIYIIVLIGFGLIYFILSFHQVVLMEYGQVKRFGVLETLVHSIYFSGVTLLTIGYGDIVPIGIGRLVAMVQALIGYILPTAFVLKIVQKSQTRENKQE